MTSKKSFRILITNTKALYIGNGLKMIQYRTDKLVAHQTQNGPSLKILQHPHQCKGILL